MNKKLLFSVMSLAALAACTNDDFDSQQIAEQTSPVQFELVNDNASMRASMKGSDVIFSAEDGDLFTLYHGATLGETKGYQNATYTATTEGGVARLKTPSMILAGGAVMVWPVDTTFRKRSTQDLTIEIPAELPAEKIQNYIPHVSDLIEIEGFNADAKYNTEGYNRTYPIYMRAMASQLTIKADYTGATEIAELYDGGSDGLTGDDAIAPISATSVDLLTGGTGFTTEIPLTFTDPTAPQGTNWNQIANNNLKKVTGVDRANPTTTATKLTTKNIQGTESAKFLILPQSTIAAGTGVVKAAVVVNTTYGKVLIANPTEYTESKYTTDEYNAAWYRYASSSFAGDDYEAEATSKVGGSGEYKDKYKVVAKKGPNTGLAKTINAFGDYTAEEDSKVAGEYMGVTTTRFVKVNLEKLDMTALHVKSDKQLRDAARVWKKLGLDPVTVYLDGGQEGDAAGEFTISQKTIEVINGINGAYNATTNPTQGFTVKPCKDTDEECTKIIITGSDYKQDVQDIAFIVDNGGTKADVVLAKETKAWKWNGTVKVAKVGVNQIVNKGTMENGATATLKTVEFNESQNNVKLRNEGTWNITAGTLNVQFDVTNIKEVNISKGAQYRQDGAVVTNFTNTAVTLPQRFLTGDAKEMIGVVNNYGVFASVNKGAIVNYGLIEHADKDAKTYISKNQVGGYFNSAFATPGNRMGRINLKYSNKDEDNISISAAAAEGFVSVTVTADDAPTDGILNADVVGERVNYIIVNGGINKIAAVSAQVKYIEINDPSKKQPNEIVWSVANSEYEGLIVLSDVNIKLNTTINVTKAAYLGADMYVGGTLKYKGGAITDNLWKGYYGDTSDNFATKYITY